MNKIERKKKCFEYIVTQLKVWYKEVVGTDSMESFTRLKLHKLLFLISSVTASPEDKKMLQIFDNFYAMPYGPVEGDIYNEMVNDSFTVLSFSERFVGFKREFDENGFDVNDKGLIDEAIAELKKTNRLLVQYQASTLVDITHKWSSWKYAREIADALGKGSERMDVESICKDRKVYE